MGLPVSVSRTRRWRESEELFEEFPGPVEPGVVDGRVIGAVERIHELVPMNLGFSVVPRDVRLGIRIRSSNAPNRVNRRHLESNSVHAVRFRGDEYRRWLDRIALRRNMRPISNGRVSFVHYRLPARTVQRSLQGKPSTYSLAKFTPTFAACASVTSPNVTAPATLPFRTSSRPSEYEPHASMENVRALLRASSSVAMLPSTERIPSRSQWPV